MAEKQVTVLSFVVINVKTTIQRTLNIEKAEGKIKYFIIGIIIGFLVMIYGVLSNSDFIIGDGIIVIGIVAVVLPFATSETVALLGYQKSRIVGRILGILSAL